MHSNTGRGWGNSDKDNNRWNRERSWEYDEWKSDTGENEGSNSKINWKSSNEKGNNLQQSHSYQHFEHPQPGFKRNDFQENAYSNFGPGTSHEKPWQNPNHPEEYIWRSFKEGREAKNDVNLCPSLAEQKALASRGPKTRFRGPRRSRNQRYRQRGTSNYKGPNKNQRSFSTECFSGAESVCSSSPYSKLSEKMPDSNDSLEQKCEFLNISKTNFAPNLSNKAEEKHSLVKMDFENLTSKANPTEFPQDEAQPVFLKYPMDKITAFQKAKEAYENELKGLEPTDVVINCRQLVDDCAKVAINQNLKKIEKFSSHMNSENSVVLKKHLTNLILQQTEFEKYITNVKGNLSSLFVSDVQELVNSSDKIRNNVENESKMFQRSLPGYGYKSDILSKVQDNQVTIITADSTYYLNILLPIFVRNKFPDHFLVSCETSEVLKLRLRNNVSCLVQKKVGIDCMEENKFNSKFKFMTEEEMGNLFLNDYTFAEQCFLVILNLTLKRSLALDIILADLRDMLQNQSNAKLILLSSNFDKAFKYESYFSSETSVAVLKLPSLILPVQTIWKSSSLLPTDDYICEVVKTILAIHILQGEGDIMAFLPTQSDTKTASASLSKKIVNLQYKDIECILLHENSAYKECLNLSSKKLSSKRTVYLVTDCAEMFVIPSVNHIIDSGLRKDYMFDTIKKLDVLTTAFISRDKSKMRKSLAGVSSTGFCYRLYSKENFQKEMPSCEYPELLTVNPFNSLIKIFQHRPTTAIHDEFVECLPKSTKENALKLLNKYDAIKDNTLTVLGKNIVKLPFSVKYSKLILLGIQWGLAYEAVVLVSFFLEKGRIFQCFNDSELQRVTDAVKLQFSKSDSDALSCVYIYKMWLENNCSKSWCEEHYINLDTLNNVQIRVNEIRQIVGDSLKENISRELSEEKNYPTLLEMLFECFRDNLCVYTGHYKSGYRVLSSHCIAFLHPSSVIFERENLPQFIIFDHMISTSRDFLMSITAIPSEFVMQALTDQTIDFDYSDMFEKSLVQKIIEPVGERMIKQMLLGKKLKTIEDCVKKELSTDSLVIEPIADKGRVLVFALKSQIDQAVELVNCILETQFEDIIKSNETHILELKRGQIKVPVELKWLMGAELVSVKAGVCETGSVSIQNNLENVEDPSDQPPCQIQESLIVTWVRRQCNGKGFVTFHRTDFMQACRKFTMKSLRFNDTEIFVQKSNNAPNQLFVTDLPPDATASDLMAAFKNMLPDAKLEGVALEYVPHFKTSQNELREIKDKIEENCRKFTKLVDFNIVVPAPEPSATLMTAYVNLCGEGDINQAVENLSNSKINDRKLYCQPVYRSVAKCSIDVAKALTLRFEDVLTELKVELENKFNSTDLFTFEILEVSADIAAIKMLSNRLEVLQVLQRTVNDLLNGELLNKNFSTKLNKIFCHGGHMWLKQTLEKTGNVYIIEDNMSKTLRLYGSKRNCKISKQRIKQFLEDTENEAVKCISLSSERKNRKLLKAIIMKFGANMEKFIESTGLQSAVLDIKQCVLSLYGSREDIEVAENCLKELASEIDSDDFASVLSDGEICPVCACPAFNLTTRLEMCGHLYCSECIQGLVDQAQFPIKCCECSKELALDDISKILGDDKEKIDALLKKSLKQYIEEHQDKIYCCPAPDCSMFFYKQEITGTKISCPLCQNDICIECNVIFHQGYTCDMYQGSKNDPDYSFKVWQSAKTECKRCPRCKTAIEKDGGCNHMLCTSCQAHICWVCCKEFPTGKDVYAHIPFCTMYPQW